MQPKTRSPLLGIALAVVLLATACGGSREPSSAANYVEFDDIEVVEDLTVTSTAAINAVEGADATPDFQEVEQLVQTFLDIRTNVILYNSDPSELEPYAGEDAIDVVLTERAKNDELRELEYLSTVEDMAAWPNIEAIEAIGDTFVVRDCTERQILNAGGLYDVFFVTNNYTLAPAIDGADPADAQLIVRDFTTVHSGFVELEDRFGCVPHSFAERAEAAASQAWTEIIAAARDPESHDGFSAVFADELATLAEENLATQSDEQLTLQRSEEVAMDSIGVDTASGLLNFDTETSAIVVVEACRRFPRGLSYVDEATGIETVMAQPGSDYVQWIHVRIPTTSGSERPDQVVFIEDYPELACGERP